jgi:hypothetical protein
LFLCFFLRGGGGGGARFLMSIKIFFSGLGKRICTFSLRNFLAEVVVN